MADEFRNQLIVMLAYFSQAAFDVDLLDLFGNEAILQDLKGFTETVLSLEVGKKSFFIGFPIHSGSVLAKKAGVAEFVFVAAVYG